MSYDGKFSCESSLKRLLARCSGLRSDRKLLALSQKVGAVTAEDIAEAIAEPFLHPNYTIPIVGCFRPLCRLIVDRAVTKLGSVPSLISMSDEESDDIGEDDTRVIDFYMERGRGLRLHEMASLALCRALDLAPFFLRCIINYFRFSPQPFARLELVGFDSQITDKGEKHLLDVIRLTYRFLIMEPQIFSGLWDWTCFLDLMQQTSNVGASLAPRRLINILDIRWCGIQILSTSLKISDRATEDFGLGSDEAFACLLRFEEFCQDTSLEKAGFYLQLVEEDQERFSVGIDNFSQFFDFDYHSLVSSTNLLKIESGIKDVRHKVLRVVPGKPFVMTSTIRRSFEMILMAVGQRWPILLHGPAGSGKTAIINMLAEISGNQVLFIHMADEMDSKMLIGNYVCSNQPGEFRWHPGSLTQAISKGYWVVFEDIDKASIEVQSIILPLLEGSNIFVTGRGEEIDVSENFRMFATISTLKHEVSHEIEGRLSFCTLWRKVLVKIPNSGDMTEIVNAWYPNLNPLTSRLMDTFVIINSHSSNQVGAHACGGSSGAVSRFSLRDLLKWCKRISDLAISVSGFPISVTDCQAIYHEAVETFVAYLPCSPKKLLMMREIAKVWGVPLPETEHDYPPNKPVIQSCRSHLQVGRVALPFTQIPNLPPGRPFVGIRSSLHALERVASSVKYNEPVLLVGETGTGKTTLVQNLAMRLGQQLTVLNLSQQSDIADLLGGYKPADARSICIPLYQEFKELFCRTFSEKENESLLRHLEIYAVEKKWKKLLCACQQSVDYVIQRAPSSCGSKRKRPLTEVLHEWGTFSSRLKAAQKQIGTSSGVYFKFVEGAFITALRNGYWILLDEINLAPPETLQRITGVLDSEKGTLCLAERGDIDYIDRHPSFRLFACMNPATDTGKRELPYSLRSRFTEYFVDDILDENDLTLFVRRYMDEMDPDSGFSNRIVHFYKTAKRESEERLQDGANQKPQFSLRSLARALEYFKTAAKTFGIQKALYDGFCMFFLTLLDCPSAKVMHSMIVSYILGGSLPKDVPFDAYFSSSVGFLDDYVLTRSVKENLKNIARAVYIKKFPVLLQGPTSSGKTSLVHYLASVTGHEFVRINNHEHTDLQEYFGTYITDSQGRLLFQEGVLVKAVRLGYWIVLDELNLAPSDVLEALNRLLDDNRELFIPELQETIRAHPNFMLFATQNPPTLYGGRKMLSRAFRNRFLEIHVDEIPEDELSMILELRCKIPPSYASKMVEVMKELQLHRQHSKIFAGKHGFITPRDLFRWANRFRMFGMSYEDLAKDGYFLLAERLRDENEKVVVREALECHLRVKLNVDNLYMEANQDQSSLKSIEQNCSNQNFGNITWTNSMKRLFFLVERCYRLREPVLLIGETGGGKTTVCQLLSVYLKEKLHILNCHQYTETSDFIGGFYPVRDRSKMSNLFIQLIEQINASRFFNFFSREELSTDITKASSTITILNELVNTYKQNIPLHTVIRQQDLKVFQQLNSDLIHLHQKWQTIFLWQDGPLVQAMKNGDLFLVDEISLADDSVLERLNSVLEPERKLSLAEKGGAILEQITAHPNFFLLATMNPGGDYGKKELSPALRNRFTEIWVPPVSDMNEFRSIAQERFINPDLSPFANHMLNFWEWFNMLQIGRSLTLRDLLSWVSFVNVTERDLGSICAFLHGSFLVLLDGLSLGTSISKHDSKKVREHALSFLVEELKVCNSTLFPLQWTKLESYGWGDDAMTCNMIVTEEQFGIEPFCISKGKYGCKNEGFEFLAPTTSRNVLRVLRAMQLSKPVLLEGSPGVGKTSLVVALAEYSGHSVVRINLSEQTDMMDLLGSDLPTQKDNGMEFSWSDGILLKALKDGSWVLLDELNLAPQSVLEGLNAILDHRAEVFIPELGLTFKCPPSFRIFACQNPSHQGGGRKSLPRSFLNRFTKVYVDELDANDYLFICRSQYPSIPETVLSNLICFNKRLFEDTMIHQKYGQEGSPWEFNLRDVIRSCQIIEGNRNKVYMDSFLNIVYLPRMRTVADRHEVLKLYEEVFELKPSVSQFPKVHVNRDYLIIGSACVKRNYFQPSKLLKSQLNILPGLLHSLEVGLHCVQQQWLCILVGPYSSRKTSLVRLLAHLTGNTLHELNLSPGTDVTDLLGSFEQYNSFRNYKDVITQVEHYIDEYVSLKLEEDWKALINQRKDLISKWFSFLASRNKNYSLSTSLVPPIPKQGYCDCLHLLIEIIELLHHVNDKLSVSWSKDDLEKLWTITSGIKKNTSLNSSANFEWVSGHLIKAIQNGDWVVLENANLCNPTVLDRINSLFEPNGSIIINECGLLDGKPMVLQAHPNFRMFITVDPKHGEVSRAMRNRGVEIFMMNQIWLPKEVHLESDREDVKRFLILSGIPYNKLVSAMTEAHMYLTKEGSRLGIRITLRELSRWVQLFQQLLLMGNQPKWSLQLSWEHTYLSSFGDDEGVDAVMKAKFSYLSDTNWFVSNEILGPSLHLPKGWPSPLTLRCAKWYSRETSTRESCLFLEFLLFQSASCEFQTHEMVTAIQSQKIHPSIIPMNMLRQFLFPDCVYETNLEAQISINQFDLTLINNMLFFAANWSIEQAMESDTSLYALLFKWYGSQVQQYCQYFNSILNIFQSETNHSIWKCICKYWKDVISYHKIDVRSRPLPVLSHEVVNLVSHEMLKDCQKSLCSAADSVRLLSLTYRQWNMESDSLSQCESLQYPVLPVLNFLGRLEKEALEHILESHEVQQIYTELIEYHMLFWQNVFSSNHDLLSITWSFLRREITKLRPHFPECVDAVLVEMNNMPIWDFDIEKHALWLYGGHPFFPASSDVYDKMQQLFTFCDEVWLKARLTNNGSDDDKHMINIILSSDLELKQLALKALCMSSYLATKGVQDDINILSKIDELYQGLTGQFEHKKRNLELTFSSTTVENRNIEKIGSGSVRRILYSMTYILLCIICLHPVAWISHNTGFCIISFQILCFAGTSISKHDSKKVREHALSFLVEELKVCNSTLFPLQWTKLESYGWGDDAMTCNMIVTEEQFGIEPFCISKGKYGCKNEGFEFLAPTTSRNVLRVLRAMQLSKPVLLEGSPGVGKTSLVVALAEYSGHSVVRINLSEQTDMMDLLGSDLPTQKDNGMEFSWSDGILLKALKDGSWVLLDELNLAPQSVLEGLNAILDHRAEVFIPELGLTFKCPPSFRIFACQNPSHQGGGRKSLPRSFLNRFTKVYVDELDANDYLFICRSQYPSIPETVLSNLICFNKRLFEDTMIHQKYGQEGSPWEFNLRDVIRSCQIIEGNRNKVYMDSFLNIVYLPRMRTVADRHEVLKLYEEVFELKPSVSQFPKVHVNRDYLIIGSACVKRNYFQPSKLLKSQLNILPGLLHSLEVGLHCVQQQWLCILVGPYSSRKTSLVRLLAHLTGNTLHELNLSPGTDVTDLLGSFEQYNSFRNYKDVITQVEHYIDEYVSLKLEEDWKALINQRKDLISKWFSFLASRNKNYSLSTSLVPPIPKQGYCDCLHLLIEIIELLHHVNDKLSVSWSKDDLKKLWTITSGIKKNTSLNSSANFEWVSGHLIKAIQNGDWVVLENANLCNPTVLDRINSLFEPNGSIIINECGLLDGKPMVLQAHPNFRMFITVDPKHGEVSRAMRNRGVEIFMMNQIWLPKEVHLESDREDVKRFLILSGIPYNKLVSAMTEAHMYLTKEGSRLGIRITLRELSRWVQLFQQLLLMGNQPKWSLQLSWEHTYLSSFGDDEGVDAVMKAKFSYLSDTNWFVSNEILGPSLHLPKGWPSPLTLRCAKWYSRETSTRESCLFLEFLLFQSASCEFQTHEMVTAIQSQKIHPSIIPMNMLRQFLFPDCVNETNLGAQISINQFDLTLINNMLFFAANWSIEQAMESDTSLYALLFKWYGSQVQQYCQYFNSILNIFQSETNHSIWKCICKYWKDVISYHKIDVRSRPLPVLSHEVVNLASHEMLKDCQKSLCSAADSVRLLSLTYRQWNMESDSLSQCESLQYPVLPVLNFLGRLEKEALEHILESHEVQQIYTELIEYHMLFWQNVFSSNHDLLSITWSFLRREITKLRPHFPECVDAVLVEMNNMPIWDFDIEKHALWLYGGHPFFPASSDVYDKMQQLFTFCDEVWLKARLTNNGFDDDKHMINIILSSDLELKQLALKALCMSSYLATKGVQDDINILSKIDELYQGLTGQFEHKKRNLELTFSSTTTIAALKCSTASCCTFCLEDLCQQSDFEEWLLTVSLCDVTSFLFDLELLSKFSKCMLADTSELHEGLLNLSDSLVHSVEYALNFSSRPPMDFTSHQTILWILDAWKTFDSVNAELSMTVIDMWFKFHSFLWGLCSKTNLMMKLDFEEICFVLPSRTAIIDKILQSNFSIVDYDIQCLKLSTTSRNLWQATLSQGEIVWFLHSAADSLFKQIIFVHYKYFTEDVFCKIRSFLCSAFGNSTLEDILNLKILISSSNHVGLCSVVDLLVEPILRELYMKHPSSDYLYNLGCAWLHIGMLRFYLLNQDGPDPALEFSFKHSNMLRKISLFDLETKVRQECQLLSGKDLVLYNEDQRLLTSQKLKEEEKQLRAKVVFRPSCSEYSHLRSECFDYGKLCSSLIEDLKNMGNISSMVLCNWQATSSKFINRLSEKYANYADLVQPVLVAVYEMKLGVSLVSSSALQKDYLEKVGGDDIQKIKAEVYSFMQFPRSLLYDSIPVNLKNYEQDSVDKFVYASATTNLWSIELMKKLINYSSETNLEKKVSPLPLDNILHYVMLIQTTDHVLYSHILDKDCFLVLNCTFDRFAKLWMDMKTQLKAKEDEDQTFKFRTRLIKIEDIMEEEELSDNAMDFDERLLSETSKNEQEFNEMMRPVEEDKKIEEEWELIHETFSKSLVRIHSLLYGSIGIVENPSARFVARDDRLISFLQSYKLGTRIIKDIDAFTPLSDDQLMPEYLFRVCLEYEEKFGIACKPPRAYNIYKDSNSIVLHKMTKPLGAIHKRVELFLVEWPDHPGLQNLGNIIEKLLSAPLSTPVSKALLGLQILVRKAKFLQENASMFSFKDLLDPIYSLISSWQKLELDSWKTLLDDVEEQFEINAAKLWFPLYAVLHRGTSYDAEADKLFTIQSIEEFVKSSNVGEFKKRLDLLFSFQGQLNHGVVLNAYSSSTMRENVNVLYNAFGYYVQFLPIVADYIETERKSIEKDLREQLKLFSWERSHDLSIESFSRMRQKIRKLVQKYNEVLQQPLMLVVHQEAISKREKIPAWLESWTSDETNVDVLQCPLSVIRSNNVKRFFWFTSWMDKANMLTKNDILCAQGLSDVKHTLTSPTSFNELEKSWEESWFSIENISRKAAQFAHIWRHGTKNLTKRRMLGNLLKVLEKSGLSRHRHISDELGISMYSHPSYNVLHLLLLGDLHKSSRNISTSNQVQSDNRGDDIFGFKLKSTNITSQDNKGDDIIGSKWKFANELYFKNLAVMNQLQEVCLNFSKDFSKEQVDQTSSFLCQLVFIQQEQRDAMYSAYEHLKKLQLKLRWMNAGEQSEDLTIAMNQSALLMLMWKQKNVFDSLLAMSRETNMLLGSFKSCHLDTCKVIKDEVDRIYSVIDMFLPRFSKSKESLDMYLLCNDSIVSAATELPFLITKKMEDLVISNSEIINAFEESILVFSFDKAFPRSIGGTLLSRFEQIIPKGKMKVLISQIDKDKQCATRENSMNLETFYTESYERTIKLLLDVYDKLYTNSVYNIPAHDLSGQIALWNQLFQSHKKVLRLEEIDDAFGETISAARKFVDSFSDRKDEVCSQMQIQLKHLYVLLDLILTFGDGILSEFLDVHAAVAELTNVLAHIFILIFSKGFGSSQEETENSKCNGTEDASGTGMGEGEGVNDVSDQIEDEAQLLGTSEKHDGQDELEKQPNGNDKGIEMEEDFDGETFSVSEDSEDDDLEDEEDPNLDSQMGQTAEGDQKVDEKQWDGDEDDNTENRSEKYEPGPAVKEKDSGSRELTAKDDNALAADDLEDIDKNQDDRLNEEDNDSKKNEDDFNSDDMVVDKSKAFEDPTDIQIEEEAKQTEDADMDEPQGSDMDESELGSFGSDEEMNDVDDKSKEDNVVDEDVSQVDNNSRIEVEEKAETANMEPESNKETLPSDTTETFEYPLEGKESIKSSGNSHIIESLMVSDMLAADNNDINSSIAPSRSLLSDEMSKIEIASNSVDNSKISYDQFQLKPENSQDSCSRTRPNPYRSLGDAMEDWKERAKVSVDPLESLPELVENLANEDAEEYEFVADAEKSTSQALAAATSDQVNNNLDNSKSSADENHRRKNEDTNQNRVKENSDTSYLNPRQDLVSKKKDDELPYMDIGNDSLMTEMGQISNLNNQYESVVSFKSSYMNEKELLLNTSTDDKAFSNSLGIEDMPEGPLQDTVLEWKKYEVSTTRLSQVLAEQLRLVMEPTLASKLQGDYKTGKRINMKKVIPYIASHFRKDKIWLRRTKPNKRNYQVVVAVDDSRSMSESNCGNAAIEALITVCRAMSQLEVGQFAVASFGRKGNVRLLHDFDEPFTGEAGVKIMSNLSFKQDNAIVDEPLADLLKYLNNMLDNAVFRARMPSGQTPLNQLVLIIADGRIHEKENLKRYVRDALNKKRLIALILLDSPEESIIDLMEASYEGDCLSFKKYLNTFPFPYYIIHRNIEALPQTLADLLRQWFELMQNAME
ncbi:midasin-like [Zingiber officinale]|uniref:midasin-like n=1 Tax=Zingiber officinale TaxID=94328 RepID=UPI001C4A76B6|nr:midasin-like [Zingiber officinale]